jgi:hypothetical protein
VPGLDFSGTGEIAQLDAVMFGSPPVLYKQIASSIRGDPDIFEEAAPKFVDPQTPLGRAAVVGEDEAQRAKELQRRLYGSPQQRSFGARCVMALRGLIYDLLHYEDARAVYGSSGDEGASSHATSLLNIARRDGRLPYLLFVAVLIALCALVGYMSFRSLCRAQQPVTFVALPSVYPGCYQALGGAPFSLLQK